MRRHAPPPQIRQWILKVLCEDVRVAKNEENFETMGFWNKRIPFDSVVTKISQILELYPTLKFIFISYSARNLIEQCKRAQSTPFYSPFFSQRLTFSIQNRKISTNTILHFVLDPAIHFPTFKPAVTTYHQSFPSIKVFQLLTMPTFLWFILKKYNCLSH